jgi:hypothetical protein
VRLNRCEPQNVALAIVDDHCECKKLENKMTMQTLSPLNSPRRVGRSIGAVVAGVILVFALSLGIDEVLHVAGVYPPWNQPMRDTSLNILALSYRIVIGVLGGYVTACLAPRAPMRHALILGAIGFVFSAMGVFAATTMDRGPMWYPIALVVTAIPCAWLGGGLYREPSSNTKH